MESNRRLSVVTSKAPALALFAAAWAVPLLAAGSDHVPSPVKHAIVQYAIDNRGDLEFARHLEFTLHAGPLSHDVRNEIGVVMRDGEYVKVHYYTAATNGKADDASALQRQEEKANADLRAGRGYLKRPVDPRYAADYRFEPAPCEGCAASDKAFAFTSLIHDEQHAHGTLVLDSGGHVKRIAYTLERPPQHASSADGVETFGAALPGLWTCVRVEESYHGHLGLISGTATMSYTLDHFHRYSDMSTASAALTERSL